MGHFRYLEASDIDIQTQNDEEISEAVSVKVSASKTFEVLARDGTGIKFRSGRCRRLICWPYPSFYLPKHLTFCQYPQPSVAFPEHVLPSLPIGALPASTEQLASCLAASVAYPTCPEHVFVHPFVLFIASQAYVNAAAR